MLLTDGFSYAETMDEIETYFYPEHDESPFDYDEDVSEDGVSYVTEAMASQSAVVAPLNVGQQPPPVHPAWRASYVMSEIRPGEVPSSVNRR